MSTNIAKRSSSLGRGLNSKVAAGNFSCEYLQARPLPLTFDFFSFANYSLFIGNNYSHKRTSLCLENPIAHCKLM